MIGYVGLLYSVVILAANIAPVDVISHIPVLCEGKSLPYVFVSSKVSLWIGRYE